MSFDLHEKMSKMKTFGTEVGVGLAGSISSGLFHSMFNTSLGYSPLSLKNFLKVGLTSGLSTMAVIAGYDEFMAWKKGVDRKPDS